MIHQGCSSVPRLEADSKKALAAASMGKVVNVSPCIGDKLIQPLMMGILIMGI